MTVLIFQGSKFFWRTRNTVDVTIVEHLSYNVTEVVCYEPSIDVEACTRVYLDTVALKKRVDHAQIEEKMSFAKRNNVPHTEKFVKDIIHQATADYILNRLFQTELSVSGKKFDVSFQLNFRDVVIEASSSSSERLIREPPSGFTPFKTCHNKIFTGCEIDEALKALEDAKQNLHDHCLAAMSLQAEPELPLGIKERWRIPIVLAKLARNRRLSGEDSKIWDAVASNLKNQEDIDRLTQVTLRTVEPQPEPKKEEPDPKPEPAPKPLTGFGRFFLPVKRMMSSTPASASALVRSPGPTPRSDSRRMMGETASSQRRANNCAEDNGLHKKKPAGTKKKTSVRRPASRQRGHSAGGDGHNDRDHSESSNVSGNQTPADVAPLAGVSADEAHSFMSQLVAGLNSALASDHNKVHVMPSEVDSAAPQALFSQRGSLKNEQAPPTRTRTHSGEVSAERRHLGALSPHLLGTASTSPSLKAEYASPPCNEPSPIIYTQFPGAGKSGCAVGHLERGTTAEISGKNSVCDESASHARKRRSYLGSFLATLSGRVDPHAFDNGDKLSTKQNSSHRTGIISFDWLLGGHGQPVVPVDLSDYQ